MHVSGCFHNSSIKEKKDKRQGQIYFHVFYLKHKTEFRLAAELSLVWDDNFEQLTGSELNNLNLRTKIYFPCRVPRSLLPHES